MSFRYKKRRKRKRKRTLNRLRPAAADTGLTGFVRGEEASDLEERVAIAFDKIRMEFQFQVPVKTPLSFPGQEKELDFIALTKPHPTPVEVDGPIGHSTAQQLANDSFKDQLINQELSRENFSPVVRLNWKFLQNQVAADRIVRRLFR